MKMDGDVTIQRLRRKLARFRDRRDWKKFHDVKNLAEALSIESAELLELFLWKSSLEIDHAIKTDKAFLREIENELADVFCFCLNLANTLDLDVTSIVQRKIKENEKKYPVSQSKGKATKYTKL